MAQKAHASRASGEKARDANLPRQIVAHLRARELGRRQYAKADRLLDAIFKQLKPGKWIPLPGRKKAAVNDNFAHTNKIFRSHGITRYEIEVTEA